LDYYQIELRDRILNSGSIVGFDSSYSASGVVSQGVLNAITAKGVTLDTGLSYAGINIFSNAANTSTKGVEFTGTYASDFGDYGHVDWTVGFNYNETTINKIFALPDVVTNVGYGQTSILTPASLSALLTGAPKEKAVLNAFWTLGKFSVNLRETVYGQTSELVSFNGTGSGAGAANLVVPATGITDLDLGYKLTAKLRLNVGANNLFDQRPSKVPTIDNRPADGNNVYNEPAQFSPYGINGGYYYGRVTYTF
jgi:iron complex outermembrane receptor protein